jgi:hypothetical protein
MPIPNRIAVFDDYPNGRERWSDRIRALGMEPYPVVNAPSLGEVESFLRLNNISEVVSDHRLSERPYAGYSGAELVKVCYQAKIGAVLLTNWTRQDADTSLRVYRRWLPCVLDTGNMGVPDSDIRTALQLADAEAREGIVPRHREPFRTVMTIARTEVQANRMMVRVMIGQWRPNEEVGFPLDMVPEHMRTEIRPNKLLLAQVNLDAECVEDLYFDNFELPDPDALSQSQAFPNHS